MSEAKPEKLDSIWPTPPETPETMGEAFVLDVVLAMEEYQCTDRADLLKWMRWGIKDDLAAIAAAVDTRFGRMVEEAKAAGFIDDKGEVRKVPGTFVLTEDGAIANADATVYWITMMGEITSGLASRAKVYASRFYSTREAAEAARRANGGA